MDQNLKKSRFTNKYPDSEKQINDCTENARLPYEAYSCLDAAFSSQDGCACTERSV